MKPKRAQTVLANALAAVHETTGIEFWLPHSDAETDDKVVLEIRSSDHVYLFAPEVNIVDRFQTPALIKARAQERAVPPILVAPFVSRETANRCRELKLAFIDTAGNAYLEGEGLFVYVSGNPRPVQPTAEKNRAHTAAGLQLMFAFLCRPDLLNSTYRIMADAANVALGTIGPVIRDIKGLRMIRAGADGELRFADPRRALDEWVARYSTTLRRALNPRRFDGDPQVMQSVDLTQFGALWGGEVAADLLTHLLQPAEFTIYTGGGVARIAAAQHLRAARTGGNVEVLEKFWNFTTSGTPAVVVPAPLIYADLMASGDGRNVEIANTVYEKFIAPAFR